MRHLAIALIMAQLAACLPDDSPPLAPADAFTSEDIAVLRTAMGRDPADSTWAGEYLADRLPDDASESDWTGMDTVGVPETALRDFGRRSRIAGPVPRRLADALGVPLVDADSLVAAAGRATQWPTVVRVSRPGYSRDGRHAVAATGFSCGPLCGSASIVLMSRGDSGWKLERSLQQLVF